MPTPKTSDPLALLDALNADGVEYVVVGGAAAVLHGAPVTTQDLDIVHRLSPENIGRLQRCLSRMHAVVREPGSRGLVPDQSMLQAGGKCDCSPTSVRWMCSAACMTGVITMSSSDIPSLSEILRVVFA